MCAVTESSGRTSRAEARPGDGERNDESSEIRVQCELARRSHDECFWQDAVKDKSGFTLTVA